MNITEQNSRFCSAMAEVGKRKDGGREEGDLYLGGVLALAGVGTMNMAVGVGVGVVVMVVGGLFIIIITTSIHACR
jgi:heme A synthase